MRELDEYDQADSFVIVVNLTNGPWIDADQATRLEELLADAGWDIEIRSPQRGEAEGTYVRRTDGSLQILGYSIPEPESLTDAVNEAFDAIV